MQYFDLVKKGNVLDLGIGEGRNSLPFAMNGFSIDGVDISATALNRCKESFNSRNLPVNLVVGDLRKFIIERNKYTLIIAANVLNFFSGSDIKALLKQIKSGIQDGGSIYLSVFSTLDPKFQAMKESRAKIEENTFYDDEKKLYIHFFAREQLLNCFREFELICCCEGIEYDNEANNPHYHGIIEILVRKKVLSKQKKD
jgi:cyclopropane fatty-acyl-phospholipid synthase-like methyltransferase